jgi:hypothetical protein
MNSEYDSYEYNERENCFLYKNNSDNFNIFFDNKNDLNYDLDLDYQNFYLDNCESSPNVKGNKTTFSSTTPPYNKHGNNNYLL